MGKYESREKAYSAYTSKYGTIDNKYFNDAYDHFGHQYCDTVDDEDLKEIFDHISMYSPRKAEELKTFPIGKEWFHFSDYQIFSRPVPYREEMQCIAPAENAAFHSYNLDECLDDIVLFLSKCPPLFPDIPMDKVPRIERAADYAIWQLLSEKEAVEFIINFSIKFGLLGVGLTGIQGVYLNKVTGVLYLEHYRKGELLLDPYLANYLRFPVQEICNEEKSLEPFFTNYYETLFNFISNVSKFKDWANKFIKYADSSDSVSENELLKPIDEILLHCRSEAIRIDGTLRLSLKVNNLLDGAYLHLINRQIKDKGFRVCKNSNCNKLFIPRRGNQKYCTKMCQNYVNVTDWRNRRKSQMQDGNSTLSN